MSSLLQLLREKEREVHSSAKKPTQKVGNDNLASPSPLLPATESGNHDRCKETESDSKSNTETNSSQKGSKLIEIWKTKAREYDPSRLVWAPHTDYKNAYFCARICDNAEAATEKYIHAPIRLDEAVVEFFCQRKVKNSKFVLVHKNSLKYYNEKEPKKFSKV